MIWHTVLGYTQNNSKKFITTKQLFKDNSEPAKNFPLSAGLMISFGFGAVLANIKLLMQKMLYSHSKTMYLLFYADDLE